MAFEMNPKAISRACLDQHGYAHVCMRSAISPSDIDGYISSVDRRFAYRMTSDQVF